jgi:hypothetical protein
MHWNPSSLMFCKSCKAFVLLEYFWMSVGILLFFFLYFFLFYSVLTKINNTSIDGLLMYERVIQCICKKHI